MSSYKIMKELLWAAVVLIMMLGGCATRYQPATGTGGYMQKHLDDDKFRVDFNANTYLKRPTVYAYLIYRCAELTLESGFDSFLILEEEYPSGLLPAKLYTSATIQLIKGNPPVQEKAFEPLRDEDFRTGAWIKIVPKESIEQKPGKTYNARRLIQELRSQYEELSKVPLPKGFGSE